MTAQDVKSDTLVLIVDDSPDNIVIASQILGRDGYRIVSATSGEQALEMAASDRPDVILLDIQMPLMDGFQVCKRLKATSATSSIPVLFVTAHHKDVDSISKGLSLGGDDYITKPFSSVELRARVSVLARLKRNIDELMQKNFELEASNRALANSIERLTQAQKVLEQLAITDPLTGLYNRRYFEERMGETFSMIGRQKIVIHMLMFDLDHFKAINDNFGHATGDAVLVHFSEILRRCVRRHDIIARIGGEEFIIAMLNIPHDQANKAAERIRSEVSAAPFKVESQLIPVTTSVGMATLSETTAVPPTLESLMQLADKALYQAKHEGRNRIVIAS
jgi:diguanylate cyclase (GGDEF)-like protein